MKGLGFLKLERSSAFLRAVEFYGLGEVFKMRGFALSKYQGDFFDKGTYFQDYGATFL